MVQRVAQGRAPGAADPSELEDTALRLFEALWRMDFLAVDLSRTHRQVSS